MKISEYKSKYGVDVVQIMPESQKQYLSELWKNRMKESIWQDKYNKNKTSIWSEKYWINLGYSNQGAKNKISDIQRKNSKKRDYDKSPSTLTKEFWINRGYSNDESKKLISDIQSKLSNVSPKFSGKAHSKKSKLKTSNSMRKYITNFGKDKWVGHFGDFNDIKYRSEDEIDIFNFISNELKFQAQSNVFISGYNVDIIVGNKIIEYFGIFWHAHTDLFEDNDMHPIINKTALEIRKYDLDKINTLRNLGYDVLVVWENEYNINKKLIKESIRKYLQ